MDQKYANTLEDFLRSDEQRFSTSEHLIYFNSSTTQSISDCAATSAAACQIWRRDTRYFLRALAQTSLPSSVLERNYIKTEVGKGGTSICSIIVIHLVVVQQIGLYKCFPITISHLGTVPPMAALVSAFVTAYWHCLLFSVFALS